MVNNITCELIKALINFKSSQKSISKDCKNKFLQNKYVSLDNIIEKTKDNLQKFGLSFVQLVSDNGVETILMHESGGFITSGNKKIPIQTTKGLSEAQAEGVAITYTKRYQLSSILGLSTDEDTDGQYFDNKNLIDPKLDALKKMIDKCYKKEELSVLRETYPSDFEIKEIRDYSRDKFNKLKNG